MANEENTTPTQRAGSYQPPAWLRYYTDDGVAPDAQSLFRAVEAYAASMDAILDTLSEEDAFDGAQTLALNGYHQTQDMRTFLAQWRASQGRAVPAVEVDADGAPVPASDATYSNAQEQSLDQIDALRRVFKSLIGLAEHALYGSDDETGRRLALNGMAEFAPRGAAVVEDLYRRLEQIPVSRKLAEELA